MCRLIMYCVVSFCLTFHNPASAPGATYRHLSDMKFVVLAVGGAPVTLQPAHS